MKKILLVLALVATVQIAQAQKHEAAKKAVDAAELATQNPKKAAKGATWLKLAEAYVKAYDVPAGNLWIGASQSDLMLVLGNQKPIAQEEVTVGGESYLKLVYEDKDIYMSANGTVAFFSVTKPVVENALEKAVAAYAKAYELEPKKEKEIADAISNIAAKINTEAVSFYNLGDFNSASESFEKASIASETAPLAQIDTNAVYNAGLVALQALNYERAEKFYKKCYDIGYYSDNGDVFNRLAEIKLHQGDTLAAKGYLTEGFEKYPESQGILIGLINFYIGSGDDPKQLFQLIDAAKHNEPNNPSLYYVEGNCYLQLGDIENASKAYDAAATIDPNYEYGYIGKGIMFYDMAVEAQKKMMSDIISDAEYNELQKVFESSLRNCIEPFETAFNLTKNSDIKPTLAEYLKNAYFRFRDETPENLEKYQFYDKFAKGE